jgi:hypothetical protein
MKKDSMLLMGNMVYKETPGIKVLQTHRAEIPGMNYAEGFVEITHWLQIGREMAM